MLLATCALLTSCTTTTTAPETTYYLFDAQPSPSSQKASTTRVMVDEIVLPDYLSTSQLVMKDEGHTILKANYHSWADSLNESIKRALINDLNDASPNTEFVALCQKCARISVTVQHFYPSTDGTLLLAGYFEYMPSRYDVSTRHSGVEGDTNVNNAIGSVLNSSHSSAQNVDLQHTMSRFYLQTTLDEDGYANAVKQMRAQVTQLADLVLAKATL